MESNVIYSIYRSQIGKIRKRFFKTDSNGKYVDIKYIPLSRLINAGEMKTPNTVFKTSFELEDFDKSGIGKSSTIETDKPPTFC